jgi:hypothetical protein
MGDHSPLAWHDQIDPTPVDSFGLRPGRNQDLPILPPGPMPFRSFPMLPTFSPKVLAPPQSTKIAPGSITNEHNIAAMPAIATIRSATRHMSLPPEANAAIPPSPTFNPDFRLVIHQLKRLVADLAGYRSKSRHRTGQGGRPGPS